MRHLIFQCPTTGDEFLIDTKTGEYKYLSPEESEETEEAEELITVNEMIEQEDEEEDEKSKPVRTVDPEYRCNTNTEEAYRLGTPMVPGRSTKDGLRIENKPVTRHSSGIRVETQMGTEPAKGVRQQRRKLNL